MIQNLRTAVRRGARLRRASAHRRTPAPGRRRRCRRLRVAACGRGRAVPPHSRGRARAERRPGLANRIAVRLGARAAVVAARDAAARRRPHRQPGPARDRGRARERRCRRRSSRSWAGSLGARRINDAALGLYERWRDRTDVVVHHVTGAATTKGAGDGSRRAAPARRRAALRARRATRTTWNVLYRDAALLVCRAGGGDRRAGRGRGARRSSCRCPARPGDHQTRNAEVLERAGAARGGAATPSATARGSPRRSTTCSAIPPRLESMGAAGRGAGPPRRRRPVRRPRRGRRRVAEQLEREPSTLDDAADACTSSAIGGVGMSAIATRARRDGTPRERLRPQGRRRDSTRLRDARGRHTPSGTTPRTSPTTSTPSSSRPRSATTTRRC